MTPGLHAALWKELRDINTSMARFEAEADAYMKARREPTRHDGTQTGDGDGDGGGAVPGREGGRAGGVCGGMGVKIELKKRGGLSWWLPTTARTND